MKRNGTAIKIAAVFACITVIAAGLLVSSYGRSRGGNTVAQKDSYDEALPVVGTKPFYTSP